MNAEERQKACELLKSARIATYDAYWEVSYIDFQSLKFEDPVIGTTGNSARKASLKLKETIAAIDAVKEML